MKCRLIVIALFFVQSTYAQKQNIKGSQSLKLDTSVNAIIPFNKNWKYPFDSTYLRASLTQKELEAVDSLLIVCIKSYNDSLEAKYKNFSIDLNKYKYKKQLVVVKNSLGEKEVWINCFCKTWDTRWKKEIMFVEDGGNCYFTFKINLTTRKFYDLEVNSNA